MASSRSCVNLLEFGHEGPNFDGIVRNIPRVITKRGIISDGEESNEESLCERMILVGNFLPLNSQRDPETGEWSFKWDEDSLLLQMKDGVPSGTEVIYVGSLKVDVNVSEQESVAQTLLEKFQCIPTFLSPDLQENFYHGFCKKHLWPLFHYMLPMSPDMGSRFDHSLYLAYVAANQKFTDMVLQAMNSDDDYVWIHDYHLMLVPTFLRRRMNRARIGFFLHSPFPSSEIYRTLPVREEILMALLNADLVGFHTFDYARHFLSCCSRMLGLDYESKRGYIGLDYLGRIVSIKILPVGIHMGRLESVLNMPSTVRKIHDIEEKYRGKKLILGVDDMDIFKGVSLKLLALEQVLQKNSELKGKLVLVQIVNPPRTTGKDVLEARTEVISLAERINLAFGSSGYDPVVLMKDPIPYYERLAFYASAECCIVNAIRDGLNLVPYEYVVCRQGTEASSQLKGIEKESARCSALIVSEFVGCSPSLSGAIRVNPWNIEEVCEALQSAVRMPASEKKLRHQKHYRYVSTHHVAYWAGSFFQDLKRACKDHYNRRCWGIGFGTRYRVIALPPFFRRLSIDHIVASYRRTRRRAIFLDYDGTIKPTNSINKAPSEETISILNDLCSDENNTVFIVSGRDQDSLGSWFSECKKLGIAAEHGYFVRWGRDFAWESNIMTFSSVKDNWWEIAEPVMRSYTESTDGSYIESKKSALVWHHCDADPGFGSCQAKELLDHLESVLANEPVIVTRGQQIVEVKPQGVGKGLVLKKLLSSLIASGKPPEFMMCIGDDRSDEDMFETINRIVSDPSFLTLPDVFACTVGQKPSKARYYVDSTNEVLALLQGLSLCQKPELEPIHIEAGIREATFSRQRI